MGLAAAGLSIGLALLIAAFALRSTLSIGIPMRPWRGSAATACIALAGVSFIAAVALALANGALAPDFIH